ncbi:MAG: hypothetical protein AB8B36_05925 [Prochlorococcus sp.]
MQISGCTYLRALILSNYRWVRPHPPVLQTGGACSGTTPSRHEECADDQLAAMPSTGALYRF